MVATRLVSPAFYTTATLHFSASRTIAADPDRIFEVLADTPRWPEWFTVLRDARWTSEPPHGVGSTRTVTVGPVSIHEQFIVWEPGVRWGFSFVGTTLPWVRAAAELIELAPVEGGTLVTHHMHLEPKLGLGLVTRAMRRGVVKGLGDGLRGLAGAVAG